MSFLIINSKILPGYIPPEKDELLSSWIFRLSQSHKIKPFSFTKFYFKETAFWNRDVDKFIYGTVIDQLTKITPLSKNDILNLHLISYKDIVFNTPLVVSHTRGITNLGIYHRKRKNYGLLACPKCLRKKCYYKKSWRLLTSLICTECKCHLIDHCSNCNSPIIFQRLDIGDKSNHKNIPIYLCWLCNFDLRTEFEVVAVDSLIYDYQKYINECITNGYCLHTQYSFLYIQILLNILGKSKTNSYKWTRVRNAFMSEFNLIDEEFFFKSLDTSIQFRRKIIPLIYFLLSNIPERFIPFCKKYSLRYSDFAKDNESLPFWFYRNFREYY
ncbi:TniQ family protein [Chryseobacterium joostei]|uniref:TniQ family protein n=1 Tax=Chryseobacterium joostei TaxID=112234 RepID=UPI003D0E8691